MTTHQDTPEEYRRIDCNFYDHFEIHAMKGSWLKINLSEGAERSLPLGHLYTKIKTLESKNGAEYALLVDRTMIRLDYVEGMEIIDRQSDLTGRILDNIDYHVWANKSLYRVMLGQPVTTDIISTMSHIYNALDIWIQRIKSAPMNFKVWQVHEHESWADLSRKTYLQLIEIINNNPLDDVILYKNLAGDAHQSTIIDIMHHLINHSTYHRGQVVKMLQQNDLPTVSTDYIKYSRIAPLAL